MRAGQRAAHAGMQISPTCSGPACFKFPNDSGRWTRARGSVRRCCYVNDHVQIGRWSVRTSMHDFTMHGHKWKFEPFEPNSAYRNTQFAILSEHFEYHFKMPAAVSGSKQADYLYNPSASYEGLVNGTWGLLRSYSEKRDTLAPLSNNANPDARSASTFVPPPGISAVGEPALCL
jgi:hypothetical protein